MAAREALWYDGSVEDLPPQLEEAVEDYVDLSHGRAIAVLPIRRPDKVVEGDVQSKEQVQREDLSKREIIGALIVEQIESQVPPDVLRSRCDLVYEHTARALNNSMAHNDLFLMPVWRTLGRATWLFKGSAFPKTMTVLSLIAVILLAMFLININLDLEANGSLQPKVKRQVFAHVDGEVEQVMIEHGQEVTEGEPLVVLKNRDLEFQMAELKGNLDEVNKQIVSYADLARRATDRLEKTRLLFQVREAQVRKASLEHQYQLLLEKKDKLVLKSPIDGKVMTWDVKKSLRARPVVTGQVLVTIADPNKDFELELLMPEKRMKFLDQAIADSKGADLPVEFIMANDPSQNYVGTLSAESIHARAELDPTDGAVVKLRVRPDDDSMKAISRLPGAKVIADVNCGKRSAAFVWFHEVVEWVQANVIF